MFELIVADDELECRHDDDDAPDDVSASGPVLMPWFISDPKGTGVRIPPSPPFSGSPLQNLKGFPNRP